MFEFQTAQDARRCFVVPSLPAEQLRSDYTATTVRLPACGSRESVQSVHELEDVAVRRLHRKCTVKKCEARRHKGATVRRCECEGAEVRRLIKQQRNRDTPGWRNWQTHGT